MKAASDRSGNTPRVILKIEAPSRVYHQFHISLCLTVIGT